MDTSCELNCDKLRKAEICFGAKQNFHDFAWILRIINNLQILCLITVGGFTQQAGDGSAERKSEVRLKSLLLLCVNPATLTQTSLLSSLTGCFCFLGDSSSFH